MPCDYSLELRQLLLPLPQGEGWGEGIFCVMIDLTLALSYKERELHRD